MTADIKTPADVSSDLAARFKARRLSMNLSREGLAARSGVTEASLKRFERTGLVSLESLLKLALVLECLDDFDAVCSERQDTGVIKSLDDVLAEPRARLRGRLK